MVKCPYCGYEGEHVLLKTWRYSWWGVYLYQCPKCGGKFRYQVDPEDKRKNYIIRIGVRRGLKGGKRQSCANYLRSGIIPVVRCGKKLKPVLDEKLKWPIVVIVSKSVDEMCSFFATTFIYPMNYVLYRMKICYAIVWDHDLQELLHLENVGQRIVFELD